jgi:hypothetical protein
MTSLHYLILAYAVALVLPLGYAALLWRAGFVLRRREQARDMTALAHRW